MDTHAIGDNVIPDGYFGLLDYAHACERAGDLAEAVNLAGEAIRIAPHVGAAYLIRGRLNRLRDDLDGAMADFGTVVKLEPGHETGWRFLGSSFTLKAAESSGMERKNWLDAAHDAFTRAARLGPDGVVHWLDLAEAELCMGAHRVAAGTAAMSWTRASGAHRTIAAWLGGIGNALAGRRQSAWQHFTDFLGSGSAPCVTKNDWVTTETETYLRCLHDSASVDARRVASASSVHETFMRLYHA